MTPPAARQDETPNLSGHASGYTVQAALDLARGLKYGPLPLATDPRPTPDEGIAIVREARRTCGFNWITGEVAEAVLVAYAAGLEAAADSSNPYPDWSDEHRAWNAGNRSAAGK